MTKHFRVTLQYPDGQTMFMGTLLAEEIIPIPTREKPSGAGNGGPPADAGERMTPPQRNYLFRLLGAQKITGKAAEEHLKKHFEVAKLSDISKAAASAYIDQLVKDQADAAS